MAVVDKNAHLAEDVEVGPFCVIGPNVIVGEGCKLLSHVVIDGNTTIGPGNVFHPFSTIGGAPQDLGFAEPSLYAASADGSVVVGTMPVPNCCFHAFRWTAATGMRDLGSLGGNSYSYGNAVSADGSVVVGSATPPSGGVTRAFRWTARHTSSTRFIRPSPWAKERAWG